jgi:hypothetical protein
VPWITMPGFITGSRTKRSAQLFHGTDATLLNMTRAVPRVRLVVAGDGLLSDQSFILKPRK